MFKIPLADLKESILTSKKITAVELELKIKNKINELSGLISEEGAAHIIANELGISLVPKEEKLKVKQIYAGMKDVSTIGKVLKKFEVREFAKEERKGKVCSIILGDETGTIRAVFWNTQVDLLQKVQEEDVLQIKHAYVKENNNNRELHLGERSEIKINPEGASITSVRQAVSYERRKIEELQDGLGAELVGTVVQIFDPRFFKVCSRCNRKVLESEGSFRCQEHGEVPPSFSYVLNLVLDDGTGTIRSVFWKNQVNHLLGKEEKDLTVYQSEPGRFESIKTDLLGEQLKLIGNARRNEMFDRLEFNVQMVEKANPVEEAKRLEAK
ncbi:hypothetical protein HYX12_02865 [Candidatus Woesearchaeota archaeon]|nr:hypothetical protein [Candidatus Woesearchaeota archaeon]